MSNTDRGDMSMHQAMKLIPVLAETDFDRLTQAQNKLVAYLDSLPENEHYGWSIVAFLDSLCTMAASAGLLRELPMPPHTETVCTRSQELIARARYYCSASGHFYWASVLSLLEASIVDGDDMQFMYHCLKYSLLKMLGKRVQSLMALDGNISADALAEVELDYLDPIGLIRMDEIRGKSPDRYASVVLSLPAGFTRHLPDPPATKDDEARDE